MRLHKESGVIFMPINELPEILTAQHISDYLGISRGKIYTLFQINPTSGGIPNFAIGKSKRVEKKDLSLIHI